MLFSSNDLNRCRQTYDFYLRKHVFPDSDFQKDALSYYSALQQQVVNKMYVVVCIPGFEEPSAAT